MHTERMDRERIDYLLTETAATVACTRKLLGVSQKLIERWRINRLEHNQRHTSRLLGAQDRQFMRVLLLIRGVQFD